MDTETLAKFANEALAFFTTHQRGETTIIVTKDETPAWVSDLVRYAHNDMFPDDHRYEMIQDSLQALVDAKGDRDEASEYIEAPIYTSDLTTWLSSHGNRVGYCDQAIEDFGDMQSIVVIMQEGWRREATEVLDLIIGFLSRLEEAE